jgi:ribosome-binding factor A
MAMSTRKRPLAARRDVCAQPYDDDGIDPREWAKSDESRRSAEKAMRRKDLQVCKQAKMAIDAALAASSDEVLRDLRVQRVEPAPDARRLRVHIGVPEWVFGGHEQSVREHFKSARGFLRCEVAAAVSRKRVPQLLFELVPIVEEEADE